MGTRAAAFTAKIHNLQHYNARIKHNLVPLPSGDDIANTLKYFSQTLLSVLKDVPSISLDMLRSPEKDTTRTALFPSLDYKSLFNALVEMVEAVPLIQHGAHALGHTILHTLSCLVPFLEHELMDTLPYLVASSMTLFPISLQKDIIEMLCNHLLPFTFRDYRKVSDESYASMSTAAVLMMIFQYTDCSAYHCQVLECLMSLKKDIVKDLLCVIAHGTAKARCHAVELLFQYLPTLNPALLDRKGIGWLLDSLCTLTCLVLFPTFSPCSVSPSLMPPGSGHTGWKPLSCQRENCCNTSVNEAVKMCFDHSVCIASGEHPPPLYICEMCAEDVEQENGTENIVDVLLPMDKVSVTCEDPDCKANDKSAVATCFSIECANRNNHRPIRYCAQCVVAYHNEEQGMDHMLHTTIPSPWNMDPETQSYMVEAVVRLLREAEPLNEKLNDPCNGQEDGEESREVTVVEERQLLSRYGIWLLVGLCTPNDNTPVESLGRLLSMLFQWFHYTACLPDDQAGNALERLKAEYIHGWLMEVVKSHFEVFVSCLLPHPVDYAKVGGHWESWPSYAVQIKEGFKRLLCLVPYDIITLEVWEYIMPYWMDAFRHEAVENEFSELKILLSKVLDPDLSPLGFNTKQMYKFLSMRFGSTSVPVQEQALYWLQILTMLEVPIPLELLYEMFMNGVANMTSPQDEGSEPPICNLIPPPTQDHRATTLLTHPSRNFRLPTHLVDLPEDENAMQDIDYKSDSEIHLPCYILMLDILIKQLELQEVPLHKGLEQKDAQSVLLLLRDLVKAPWVGIHTCIEPLEGIQCVFCEVCAIFFQLSLILVEYFSPVMEVTMADIPGETLASQLNSDQPVLFEESEIQMKSDQRVIETDLLSLSSHKEDTLSMHGIQNSINEEQDDSVFLGHISPIQTATVQECMAQLDTVTIIPTEKVMTAMAREVMLTEDDVAGAKCTVASAILLDENDQAVSQTSEDASFWHTSEGKFKFAIEELPPQLQLFYVMLKDLASFEDADVLYHILSCLKVMCLHSEILNKAAHNHKGFLIWCQENLLITSLWKLLQSEFSHIAQLASSLLLHSITLPSGSDMFWKTIERDFHNEEWRSRYAAVEKVTMIAHFVDGCTVKNSPLLQSALANAFSYLVHCLNDDQPTISQRALLNLETIKTPSLKLFVWCLEVQFDSNIMDRPMIIQTIFQIYNHLSTKRFLTWDFFLNRFDTLFLENQVTLERYGEISYVRDLKNTNVNSEMFLKKLKRAQESLSHTSSTKSLTSSLGGKMPYKRTMSAPSAMISRQDKIDKDKPYERQSSAPVLKRKSSRLVGSTVGALGPSQHFPNSFFTDGHLKDTIQEETHFLNVLHRAMDTEDHDNETLHLLVFLLMQFLSRPDPVQRTDDKVTRSQHIVLRHLNILLGYSQNQGEGRFLLPPHKVRTSSVFSTFLMCMPKVLDYNFAMGNYLLTTYLSILLCCPSSQKYPSEHYPPTYSLWLLDPYCRHSWLQSTLVIMYKYHYDTYPYCKYIQWLVIIVLNTLKAQRHRCKQLHESLLSPLPSRSRDFSTPSADLEHVLERERDTSYEIAPEDIPKSFTGGAKAKGLSSKLLASDKMDDSSSPEQNQKASKEKNERHQWKSWKSSERSCSSEGEDAEPELEAIPESPKSESSELEQFTSDFACLPQTIDPVCVQLTCDPLTSSEHVVVTNPWSGMSEEATLVTNSASLDGKIQSQYELPLDAEVTVIEKSTVEVMEKHIDQNIPGNISLKSDSIERKFLPEVKAEDPVLVSSYFLQSQSQQELFPSLKMQAEAFPEKDNQVLLPMEQKSESHPFQFLRTQRSTDTHIAISKQRSLDVEKNEIFTIQGVTSGSHQGVARSKTDSNILDLPQSEDAKMSHSRYPKPKFFMGKKSFLSKQSRKAEILSSENLTVPIFRPPLERLLPIGLHERERLRRSDTYSLSQPPAMQPMPHQLSLEQYFPHDMSMSRESEDKGVQTGAGDIPFDIPAPERLLPIGPMPSKKDWYTTAVFKATMPVSVTGDDRTVAKAERVASDSVTKVLQSIPKIVQVDAQEAVDKHEKVVDVHKEEESVIDDETENQIAVDDKHKDKLGNMHGKEETFIHNAKRVVADKHEMAEAVVEKHEKEEGFFKKYITNIADQEDLPRSVDVKANLNEDLNVSALGAMASENLVNKIFDLTSDMAPPMSTFGVFDVCKSVMDMKSSDDTKSGKKLKDNEALDQRNSSSSMELLPNEKAEVLGFTHDSATVQKSLEKAFDEEIKCRLPYRQRKQRKAGLSTLEAQRSFDYQNAGARRIRKVEMGSIASLGLGSKRSSTSQSSNPRSGDDVVAERCTECGSVIEEYSDEEIGLCIVILATFVHREPSMAAPMLPKMLRVVARIAASPSYPWQNECNVHLPGGSVSVARQFLRCTLHQLAPNGVFVQIFQSHTIEAEFYKTMAAALADFTEVNQVTPLLMLLENLNDRKHLHHEIVLHILDNVAIYLDCLPLESNLPPWGAFLQQLDLFLRKFLLTLTPGPCQLGSILQIMLCALKLPVINGAKCILDPFSKILSHAIQHSVIEYKQLSDICHVCYRNMCRERDKLVLTRTAIFELVQALKFKSSVPDGNLLTLVQFVLDDSGGSLGPNVILEGFPVSFESQSVYNTSAGECMRQYLNDTLEFVADVHTLNKVKNMLYGNFTHLNEETLGGHLKAGIAQYLAIEISKGNGRDNRAIGRYLPWLYHPPTTLQQGPKEFIDCVSHIRLLSWLLLGALIHSALMQNNATFVCQPIPLEANSHIAEHIQVILAGFSEQSKVSVLHMSSLFHAFILCQLWTMYCEHMVALNPPGSEQNQVCVLTLTDFWAKVTPGILQLVCHSKVEEHSQLAEMVSLHFLSLMEALQECNSTILARLLPMWTPVLYSFQGQLPGNLHVRLQMCVSCQPPSCTREDTASVSTTFLRWLQRLQFKMGQIELQSSTATQFYSL